MSVRVRVIVSVAGSVLVMPVRIVAGGVHRYFVTPWNSVISSWNSRGSAPEVSSMQ